MAPCILGSAALGMLEMLPAEHRRLHEFKVACSKEAPLLPPVLRRLQDAEALPTFLHGGRLQCCAWVETWPLRMAMA